MPRPRFDKLPEEKQASILRVAAEEFAERGYAGASMNRIIERAGLSKGAMYYYFDDKEDLYSTAVIAAMEQVVQVIGDFPEVGSAEEFWQALEGLVKHTLLMASTDPTLLGLMRSLGAAMAGGEIGGRLVEWHERMHHEWTESFVRLGQRVGAVRTDLPDELLFALLEALNQAGDLWFARHVEQLESETMDRLMDKLMDIYHRILQPDPNRPEEVLP